MTALDQAFIRAYSHQGASSTTWLPAPNRPTVPLSEALGRPAPPKPAVWSAKVTLDNLLDNLQKDGGTPAADERSVCDAGTRPVRGAGILPSISDAGILLAESSVGTLRAETNVAAPPVPKDVHAAPSRTNSAPSSDLPATSWRAMLQVDHFVWPKTCERLSAEAAEPMDRMTDALAAMVRQGRKVMGLGGCGEGEGVTTLTLAVGRGLVEQGLNVVLVDANWPDPQLARRLGLLPQVGWAERLAGRLPLEEVVVESIADRLAVLPICEPYAGTGSPTDETHVALSLETLAKHYDVVLVDLGSLEDRTTVSGPLGRAVGRCLQGVVLVHNVRQTTPGRLADVHRCLAAAGMAPAGVVENFVAN